MIGGMRWQQKPPRGTQLDFGHPLARGLVGGWTFNEASGGTTNDISGYANKGTLTGGATWVSSSRGPVISLDGSTGYVDCGNSQTLALGIGTTAAFSLSIWVNCAVGTRWNADDADRSR